MINHASGNPVERHKLRNKNQKEEGKKNLLRVLKTVEQSMLSRIDNTIKVVIYAYLGVAWFTCYGTNSSDTLKCVGDYSSNDLCFAILLIAVTYQIYDFASSLIISILLGKLRQKRAGDVINNRQTMRNYDFIWIGAEVSLFIKFILAIFSTIIMFFLVRAHM